MFHQSGIREHARLKISLVSNALTTSEQAYSHGFGCHLNVARFAAGSARKACIVEILVLILKVKTHRFHGGGLV
jgi:hypothetical protein